MLVSTFGLLAAASSLVGSVSAQDSGQIQRSQLTFLSHLSPLFEYSPFSPTDDPDAGWNVSLDSHATNHTGAEMRMTGLFINNVDIQGTASNVDIGFESLGDDDRDNTEVSIRQTGPIVASVRRNAFTEPRTNVYNITVSTNSSDGSYLAVDRVTIYSSVPGDRDETATAEHMSATDPESSFFQAETDAWEIMEPPSNQSAGVQFQLAGGELPLYGADYPYSSTVLSTSRVGSPLRFSVPPYTSYLQWYGTVGPDQGRYEFRLIPTGDQEPQFQPIANNQSYTGERSVDAIYETKGIAWLDPRVSYDAEIELLEEGKRTDLHGVSFWRYTPIGAELEDWWSVPKDNSLSGGQIAGIVIGSVAGAALIGLAIWFIMRRRKRSRTARSGSDAEKLQS